MTAEPQGTTESPPKRGDWEWFWRFLSVVMVFVVGWVIWIAVQISPQPLATPAAYEAAAKAASRNAQGQIKPAAPIPGMRPDTKLRLTDTLERPPPEPAQQ